MKKSETKQQIAEEAVAYFADHPTASWAEAHAAIPNHYSSYESMRRSLRELTEGRIAKVPKGVITDTAQQQAIIRDGRGVAEGSPDAVRMRSNGYVSWDMGGSAYEQMSGAMKMGYSLRERYIDYGDMDNYDLLSSALDVYADEATVRDVQKDHCVWATGEDALVRNVVDDLLYRRLDVEADVWACMRSIAKYGQACAEVIVSGRGVVGLHYLPIVTMKKIQDNKGILVGYMQSLTGDFPDVDPDKFKKLLAEREQNKGPDRDGLIVFKPWEIVWWQMPSRQVRSPYGVSVLDAARGAWKRLVMLEDSVVVYLLTRSPARNAVYVDTQDMPPAQAMAYLQDVKAKFKKRRVVDPSTGQIDYRMNVLASDEDLFIPVRGGREATRVDVIAGPEYNIIDQLEFFRQKLFNALRMPKAYFGMSEDASRGGLSQTDVVFARTIMRLQRQYMTGLLQVVRLHLALLDVDPDLTDIGLDMTVPSSILEMAQIETGNARAALAAGMDPYYDKHTILTEVFGESDDVADAIMRRKRQDFLEDAGMQGEAQTRMAERAPAMPVGEMPELPAPGEGPTVGEPAAPPEAQMAPQTAEEQRDIRRRVDALNKRMDDDRIQRSRQLAEMRALPRKLGKIVHNETKGLWHEIRAQRRSR